MVLKCSELSLHMALLLNVVAVFTTNRALRVQPQYLVRHPTVIALEDGDSHFRAFELVARAL